MRIVNDAEVELQDRELVITRIFDAPRSLVFKVWTEPEHVKNWWGPGSYTAPRCEVDLKLGGEYLYVMRSPEGQEFPVQGKFMEIVKDEKLVYSDDMFRQADFWKMMIGNKVGPDVDFSTVQLIVTVKFDEVGTRSTRLTLTTRFFNNEVRDAMVGMMMAEGWTSSLQKFAAELAKALTL
ncbi:MAG: SRPBCC domain-containing protein [Bacteroidetes bacterium]|nr:SRPBCC domain-containing protein [Bacteroidota bacterium]